MAHLFLSHSSADDAAVERVSDLLAGLGTHFVDHDAERGIAPGRDWEATLYTQLLRADAVIFVGTAASVASPWCFAEVALARALGKPVIPVRLERSGDHPLLRDTQAFDLLDGEPRALRRALEGLGLDEEAWDPGRSPYPGLAAFDEADAGVFFGRRHDVATVFGLLTSVRQRHVGCLLALVGASGSGKSSLLRAGLLPRLRRSSSRWLLLPVMQPRGDPRRQLALTLLQVFRRLGERRSVDDLERQIADGPQQLGRLVDELCALDDGAAGALLVVDQAEELVGGVGVEEAVAFLTCLHGATRPGARLWVVAALRSDLLASVLELTRAPVAFDEVQLLAPVPNAHLAEVVARPAVRAGLRLEDGLVERAVADTGGGDALPLLAYTLERLYAAPRDGVTITHAAYDALGGVSGALAAQADLAAVRAGASTLPALIKLVTLGPTGEPIRRRVRRTALTTAENAALDAFVDARLVVAAEDGGEPVVMVAHEALLRQWRPLAEHIAEHRQALLVRAQLERLANDWVHAGRRPDYLVRGERLVAALRWRAEDQLGGDDLGDVAAFIEQSARADDSGRRDAADTLAHRVLSSTDDPELAVLMAVAAATELEPTAATRHALQRALARYPLRWRADHAETSHDRRGPPHHSPLTPVWSPDGSRVAIETRSRMCVQDAATGMVLVAVAASDERLLGWLPGGAAIVTVRGHRVIVRRATDGEPIVEIDTGAHVLTAAWSPDGRRLATAATELGWTFSPIALWDLDTGRSIPTRPFGHVKGMSGLAWAPDGQRLASAAHLDHTTIWDDAGNRLRDLGSREVTANVVVWSPDSRHVVTTKQGREARLWDVESEDAPFALGDGVNTIPHAPVVFAHDGRHLAFLGHSNIRIWDVERREQVATVTGYSPTWSADGEEIATIVDGAVTIWESGSGRRGRDLRQPTKADRVSWSPSGSGLLTSFADDSIGVWDVGPGELRQTLRGTGNSRPGASWSPDGRTIATWVLDARTTYPGQNLYASYGRVWVWDAPTGRRLHEFPATTAAFSPAGTLLATADHARSAVVRSLPTGEVIGELAGRPDDHSQVDIAWSPDGRLLAVVTFSGLDNTGNVRIWEPRTDRVLMRFDGASGGRLSWSPTGERFATATDEVRVHDAVTGEHVWSVPAGEPVKGPIWSPDGTRIATFSYSGVTLWDADSGERLVEYVCTQPSAPRWSPDGRRFAVIASQTNTGVVVDSATGTLVHEGDLGKVLALVWSPDGTLLAGGWMTGTRVLDDAGELCLEYPEGSVPQAFSPDGRSLATAGGDGTVRIWEVPHVEDLVDKARRRTARPLTPTERARCGLPAVPPG